MEILSWQFRNNRRSRRTFRPRRQVIVIAKFHREKTTPLVRAVAIDFFWVAGLLRHSAGKPQPKLTSAAEAASRRSRHGRAEARPSYGVEILRAGRRI